ncbi:MAG TPA: hypothetical protein VIE65_21050 [Methylobacter sp.]
MAIKSNAFGRVTLTEKDAQKFKNQVTFGKPKAAALESVKRGVKITQSMRDNGGRITFSMKRG